MLFVIHCLDKDDGLPVRMAHYPAHRAFLEDAEKYGVRIVTSGPLVKDDGTTPIGSLIIVDAKDRAGAEGFNRADPFHAAQLWRNISITAFDKKRG